MSRHGGAASVRVRAAAWLAALVWLALTAALAPAMADAWRVRDGFDLNARAGPGTGHVVIETLRSGAVVEELDRDENWSRIRTPTGNVAFVHNGYLEKTGGDRNLEPAAETAWRAVLQLGHGKLDYGDFNSVAFSPDGRTIASGSEDGTVRLWETASGRQLRVLEGRHEGSVSSLFSVYSVAFSPDGRTIASGSRDYTVRLWDAASGRQLRVLAGHGDLAGRGDTVYSVAFSPDGRTIASGSDDATVRLWDAASGRALRVLEGHWHYVNSVAFSPDGRTIASGSRESTVRLWETASGRQLRVLEGHGDWFEGLGDWFKSGVMDGSVLSVAFSPDGRTIASGSNDETVRLWDAASGRQLRVLKGHLDGLEGIGNSVFSVAFSPDGRTIAGGSGWWGQQYPGGNTVRLWDAASGRQLQVLDGHWASVRSVAFSPDGRTIASGSLDKTVRLWDAASGRQLRVLEGHWDGVLSVAFSPDGRTIASGSWDGTVRLWDIATGRELALFATFADGSWIILTPEGFFNASEGGARHLNLVRGLEVFSVDQVHDALFRPDLVREVLTGDPDGRVAAAAARLDLGKVLASGLPPRVSGLRSLDGDAVEGDAAELSAEIEDRGGGIGRIEWRVNGIVQGAGSRGLGGLEVEDDGVLALRKRLFLTPGENAISVTVYNSANLIASDPLEITVVSRQGSASPPKLHVLAVGVDDYFDSDLKLNYAVSDTRALGTALRRAGRDLYASVEVSYLLDKAVSAEGLGAAFEAVGRVARPQDAFVFFLAGHGKTLDGRYYFLPRDFRYRDDDDLKKTAVSQEQLQSWVSRVSAQKSVLLLDTCESGSLTHKALVGRGLEDKAAINRLSRAVGRTILTAATDTTPALEGYRQHGLFTYVLLEAFAKGDADGDNQVEIGELIGYVDARLPELSEANFGYRQVPQYRSQGNIFALGRPVTILSETEELIPRTPTHVVISKADIIETPGDPLSVIETFAPGVTVRVVEQADAWVRIAVNGARIGWVETARLAVLQ